MKGEMGIARGDRRKPAMTVLKAIVKDGKIELDAPGDWPEGTEVRIEPIPRPGSIGIRDVDWPTGPTRRKGSPVSSI